MQDVAPGGKGKGRKKERKIESRTDPVNLLSAIYFKRDFGKVESKSRSIKSIDQRFDR